MKMPGTLVVALALALSAQAAPAHIVEFVTSVPMTAVAGVQDEAAVSAIIVTAVKDALRQAVAFRPTLVLVRDARGRPPMKNRPRRQPGASVRMGEAAPGVHVAPHRGIGSSPASPRNRDVLCLV
jgi:hypothetical protein